MESNQLSIITNDQLNGYLDTMGLATQLNNNEKTQYLEICKAFGLNPFKREIHVSKYNNQMSIITGYEVYIKRAERSGQLDGWGVVTEGSADDNTLKATVTIHRKDRKHPFVWEAYYKEFVQKTRDGRVTKFWEKAEFMIKKVAIAQGFRLCFSDELGGMPYTSEEMPEKTTTEGAIHTVIEDHKIDLEEMKAIIIVATDEEDLADRYKSLPIQVQKNEEIISLCRTIKQGFINA